MPRLHIEDPIRLAMRDEKLWRREVAMYAAHRIKLMHCPCKICKGNKKQMAMGKVQDHLMANGRHHSFRIWKGPGPRDDSDNEWDDHIRSGGARFARLPLDENVGLQSMFHNVNASIPVDVPPHPKKRRLQLQKNNPTPRI